MLQVLKSKRAPAVADLSARLDEINAEIASVIDDIDEAKRRVGSAMLTGDDLEAAKERLVSLERDRDVLNAARAEADRLLTEHRKIEDEAEGRRLRAKQRRDCDDLDKLLRHEADLIGEIEASERRLAGQNTGVSRPMSQATSAWRDANRLPVHAGHDQERRRADLDRFIQARRAVIGFDYASSALSEVLLIAATSKDEA